VFYSLKGLIYYRFLSASMGQTPEQEYNLCRMQEQILGFGRDLTSMVLLEYGKCPNPTACPGINESICDMDLD
jgi:hypothetical protein